MSYYYPSPLDIPSMETNNAGDCLHIDDPDFFFGGVFSDSVIGDVSNIPSFIYDQDTHLQIKPTNGTACCGPSHPHPSLLSPPMSCTDGETITDDVPELEIDLGDQPFTNLSMPPVYPDAPSSTINLNTIFDPQTPLDPPFSASVISPSTIAPATSTTTVKRRKKGGAADELTRREKNRISAKECRKRKKDYQDGLEEQLNEMLMENKHLKKVFLDEQQKTRALTKELEELHHLVKSLQATAPPKA